MPKRLLIFLISAIFLASLSLSLFALSFSLAFAQDAIQCKPPNDEKSGINLINNLRMASNADDRNDIYLGTGKIYFGGDSNNPSATKSGSDLLFYSPANVLTRTNNNIIFQNTAGNRLVGIYNGGAVPAAVNSNHYLIVDGKIEGYQVNGLNELCVQGTCISSWDQASGQGTGNKITYTTNTTDSWNEMHFDANTRLVMEGGSSFIIQNGANIKNYGTYIICSDPNNTPDNYSDDVCSGDGKGVSKIIQGTGIKVTSPNPPSAGNTAIPPYGEGNVTIENTGVTKIIAGPRISISPASGNGDVTITADPPPTITCIKSICVKSVTKRVNCDSSNTCAFNNNMSGGCNGPVNPMPSPVVISGYDVGAPDGSYFCNYAGGPIQGYDYCEGGGTDASYANYECDLLYKL